MHFVYIRKMELHQQKARAKHQNNLHIQPFNCQALFFIYINFYFPIRYLTIGISSKVLYIIFCIHVLLFLREWERFFIILPTYVGGS